MKIYNIQLGYGTEIEDNISLNIYISGCKDNKRCKINKCHNLILRDFEIGVDYRLWYQQIFDILKTGLVDCIILLGGEPLDQEKEELFFLIDMLKHAIYFVKLDLQIYVYTGYNLKEKIQMIKELFKKGIKAICIGEYNEKINKKKWIKEVDL